MPPNSELYLLALLLTAAVELVVSLAFGYRRADELAAIVLVNVITNPLLNYSLALGRSYGYIQRGNRGVIMSAEVIVVVVEWLLLWLALRRNPKKLLALAITMNLCSYLLGVLLFKS